MFKPFVMPMIALLSNISSKAWMAYREEDFSVNLSMWKC